MKLTLKHPKHLNYLRELSYITSASEGGGSEPMLTFADEGGGGCEAMLTNADIGFLPL